MKEVGHQGVAATLPQLKNYRYWSRTDAQDTKFVRQCLHWVDSKADERFHVLQGRQRTRLSPGMLHLYLGNNGPLGADALNEGDGFKYILVIMDDLSNFVWLEPMEACTATLPIEHLLRWCTTLGVPIMHVGE